MLSTYTGVSMGGRHIKGISKEALERAETFFMLYDIFTSENYYQIFKLMCELDIKNIEVKISEICFIEKRTVQRKMRKIREFLKRL